jgi:hypothetical protein
VDTVGGGVSGTTGALLAAATRGGCFSNWAASAAALPYGLSSMIAVSSYAAVCNESSIAADQELAVEGTIFQLCTSGLEVRQTDRAGMAVSVIRDGKEVLKRQISKDIFGDVQTV